ncbi:hypothetical protein MTBSS4_250012 [Magnetospirillum sp. SS-4]|nr:hypothetical protein MTBSS4_250012 [Magnetospirillum sp. SS-4]
MSPMRGLSPGVLRPPYVRSRIGMSQQKLAGGPLSLQEKLSDQTESALWKRAKNVSTFGSRMALSMP